MPPLLLSPAGRRYGKLPDPPDIRDYRISHPAMPFKLDEAPLVARTLNKQWLGPVRDQGDEGSCTGHAAAGNRDFLYNKLKQYEKVQLADLPNFSPQFAYYMGRQIDGSLGQGDCGSTGRSVALGLRRFGICQESDWPYVAGQFDVAPSSSALEAALNFIGGAFHAITTVEDIKACLRSGYAVMLGFSVWESFEQKIGSDGLMPTPDYSSEQQVGGHEVLMYDYDDEKTMADGTTGGIAIRNSWGSGWGDAGDFYASYKQLADPNIFLDSTLQHMGKPWGTPQ